MITLPINVDAPLFAIIMREANKRINTKKKKKKNKKNRTFPIFFVTLRNEKKTSLYISGPKFNQYYSRVNQQNFVIEKESETTQDRKFKQRIKD